MGCLPVIVLHGALSLGVLLFALPAIFLGGHPANIVFVIWWLLGTYGLMALVYSCAVYRRDSGGPKPWQQIGLIIGVVLSLPVAAFGFTNGLGIVAVFLGAAAASIVLFTDRGSGFSNSEAANKRSQRRSA